MIEKADAATIALAAIGRRLFVRVAEIFAEGAIDAMPLKGVMLAATAYRGKGSRAITDVDVLVREEAFDRACGLLRARGFEVDVVDTASISLVHRDHPLPLDLHRSLFRSGLFDLPTPSLFERGRVDTVAFGTRVILPDPRDAFAHAIGHFVKSRPIPSPQVLAADLSAIASAHPTTSSALAIHLETHGLARAARLALAVAAEADAAIEPLARSVLAALKSDPLGERLARLVAAHLLDAEPSSFRSLVGQHVLSRNLRRAGRSATLHAYDTFSRRARTLSSFPSPSREPR